MNRAQLRKELIQKRISLEKPDFRELNDAITMHFHAKFDWLHGRKVGLYWPIMGEFDSIPLMMELHQAGCSISLPTIEEKNAPLAFKKWHPNVLMGKGPLAIHYPLDTAYEQPEILIIPLVGFDSKGYRLGYGAGYYDRTLHSLNPTPITIGIGFELNQVDSIAPHSLDVRMEFILTEKGLRYFQPDQPRWLESGEKVEEIMKYLLFLRFRSFHDVELASPVCYGK
ncbi:5-formyltetrahydrofolate cyclo-ligase [Methylobacillus caricis]|uniref:5-formyltetrahydrofolate cyclo-ligase n=1 Tax=Methylobacillus caricis TaxID=1971611 RepID=UPI001CFF83BB|nr:5-formyltetrahydrofolate cyclo-ligase [Methylobacillus caricis]MCB5186648.1 5-formyltetrahydrofolate cyclo-ligase [Methylobacillus caricis]